MKAASEFRDVPLDVRKSPLFLTSTLNAGAETESVSAIGSRKWMKLQRTQRMVNSRRFLRRLTIGLFARLELLILDGHKNRVTLSKIRRCRSKAESLLTGNEAFLLHSLVTAQCGLDGGMAELGVYQGSSAQIICEAKKDRPLYLFDTFAGMPRPDGSDRSIFSQGQFAASLLGVRSLLSTYQNVCFFPGLFHNQQCLSPTCVSVSCTWMLTYTAARWPDWSSFIPGWFPAVSLSRMITRFCRAFRALLPNFSS